MSGENRTRRPEPRKRLTRKRLTPLVALLLAVAGGCRDEREAPVSDAGVPLESAVDAPWVESVTGIVEESAPGSGVFLLQPGDYRARLPDGFHRSGLRVVFSGRPQPVPAGRRMIGTPFVLTAIRKERSAVEVLLEQLREAFGGSEGGVLAR